MFHFEAACHFYSSCHDSLVTLSTTTKITSHPDEAEFIFLALQQNGLFETIRHTRSIKFATMCQANK